MPVPPTAAPDPFLSSLIYTLPMTESKDSPSENLDCEIPVNRSLDGKTVERYVALKFLLIFFFIILHRLIYYHSTIVIHPAR